MPYVKIVQSGTLLEIYEYERDLPRKRASKAKIKRIRGYKRVTKRRHDNVLRQSKSFKRIITSNLVSGDNPAFLTVTMAQTVRIEDASRIFTRFIERFRSYAGKEFRYIAVPEFQRRGAVHFHILIWGLQDKLVLDEGSTRTIQRIWGRGFVDIIQTDGSVKLAGYLAKYMRKALYDERLGNKRSYFCSRNVLRPVSLPFESALGLLDDIYGDKELTYNNQFNTMWLGRCDYKKYNLIEYNNNGNTTNNHDSQSK